MLHRAEAPVRFHARLGLFAMEEAGLVDVSDPSSLPKTGARVCPARS
jgi:hypothetical protein